jgi:hypothetical protein
LRASEETVCHHHASGLCPDSGATMEDVQSYVRSAFAILPVRNVRFSESPLPLVREVIR